MKDFRIETCIEGDEAVEYAIFSDGSRKKRIKTDKMYGKYFEVDNEFNTSIKNFTKYYFTQRIKDAVDTILAGNGDCIQGFLNHTGHYYSSPYDYAIEVRYYINRDVGEKLRQKSINGWKDTEFAYIISYGRKDSAFYGCRPLMKNFCQQLLPVVVEEELITFDSEQAAIDYANQLIEKSKSYAQKISSSICDDMTCKEKGEIVDKVLDEIEKEFGKKYCIVTDFASDMLGYDYKPVFPNFCLNEFKYKIDQIVIHKPQDKTKVIKKLTTAAIVDSAVTDTNEAVSHIVNCLESDDKRFSFELACGRMISIYDKDKKKSYNISVQPVE